MARLSALSLDHAEPIPLTIQYRYLTLSYFISAAFSPISYVVSTSAIDKTNPVQLECLHLSRTEDNSGGFHIERRLTTLDFNFPIHSIDHP
ncbi:MAG: hypothetical protein FRX48_01824 [Lasallia pustulata]|uniref:Uncharacterized protein n=1 Tax=Lasallia pustulata TaxID=136370 RepID=A0A5M8Q163_9LECA|nr:MAG: hypothetical protein FRX48_01824 [Lasallia pustulata]